MDHIGIDVHKRDSQIYILAEGGEVIERRIRTEPQRFDAVLGTRPRARIVIESVANTKGRRARPRSGWRRRVGRTCSGALADAVTALTRVMREALAFMNEDDRPMAADAPSRSMQGADRAVTDMLRAYAESSPWPASDEAGGWALLVETAGGAQRISARVGGGCLRFTAPLVRRQPCEPAARAAVSDFLLALNEHICLARGAVGDAGVQVEVVVPAWSVSSGFIDRAVGALIVATAVAKRECVALLDPAVAAAFCAFHKVGVASGAGAADEPIFGLHEERSTP